MSNIEQFGKYILLEKLAAGGMAEVYLAKSNGANGVSKFVAIKRILPQFSDNEDFIEMFKVEANVAINLNHSNIVSIYDFGIEKGQFYLVMEFVEGRNLRQILNELKKANKSVSIEQAVYIIKEAAAGLDHAHRCSDSRSGKPLNITHRDMSPQNIMISFEGDSKVIDFGIAKAEKQSDATKAGTLKGKFAYMSPEQSEGLPIDPRTDVFALGIILWELLANDRLFTGSNEGAILRKVRECQIPPIRKINPLVPPELERIVTKALAKDKNIRYQTAASLQKDLNRFLNTQYPDFSSQDFSVFIKDCFKAAFTEGREKLVQYGKISSVQDVTQTTKYESSAPKTLENKNKDLPPIPTIAIASPSQLPGEDSVEGSAAPVIKLDEQEQIKISLDGIRGAGFGKSKDTPKRNHTTFLSPSDAGQSTRITQVTHLNKVSKTNGHYRPRGSTKAMPQSNDMVMKLFFVIVFGLSSFWGYKTYLKPAFNTVEKSSAIIPAEIPAATDQGEYSIASSATRVNISMSSQPNGARIYIDGKDTGQITPSIVPVESFKDLVVSMQKEGFAKYETTKRFEQISSFTATLQVPTRGGYLNIYVVNGGARPAVFVNGLRLSEDLPIKKYWVPANTDIFVSAENAITRLHDQVKIKVGADQMVDVELILGRSPSSSRNKETK